MNSITIKGRLTRDPELKTATSGIEICHFTVAVNRRPVKDKEDQADFFDCTAFGKTAAAISKYMTKGREILVQGRMESNKTEKDGVKRTYWGIAVDQFEFCGSRNDGGAAPEQTDSASGMPVVETEELPF